MEPETDDNGEPIARAERLFEDGSRHYELSRFVQALELWRTAQTLLSKSGLTGRAEADALMATLAMSEGNVLESLGRSEEALATYAQARDLHALPHLAGRQELDRDRAGLAMHEGIALRSLDRIEEALAAYTRAWALHGLPHLAARLELDRDRAALARNEGIALRSLGRGEEALTAYARAWALHALSHLATRPELDVDRARLAMNQGNAFQSLGRLDEALAAYARAWDLHALPHLAERPELDVDRARLAMNEGNVLDSLGRLEEALAAYARARELHALPHLAARLELDRDRAALAMSEGSTLDSLGRFEEALAACARARELHALPHLALRPGLDRDRAMLAENEGNALQSVGRLEEALAAYARARELLALPHLAARPELDEDRASLAMNEGNALQSVGRFEEALAACARARELHALPHLALRPELDRERASLAMNEGNALQSVGRLEEALAALARARDLYARPHLALLPELDADRARVAINEGNVLQSFGRLDEALAAYARARELHALPHLTLRPELDWERASLEMNEGAALKSLGRLDKALAAYARARELHTLPHLVARPELDDSRSSLAMNEGAALKSLGCLDEALSAYARARDLHALPHLASRPELNSKRARSAMKEGITLAFLGRIEEVLSAFQDASRLWSSQRDLPLPEQERFALSLALMSALLDAMAVEDPDAARAWALGSSDRLVEMLDLALPEGKVWDDLREHFATFHVQWLAWCLKSSDPADRSLVPRVLAAVQGRRLVAETLEQAMALGEAAAPEIRDVLAIKAEIRALLEALGTAEGAYDPGGAGRDGPSPSGTRGGCDTAVGFGEPPRDAERIAAIRAQLQSARDRLAVAKRAAAELPEFAILTAPLSGIGTAALAATLAPDEALVLAFPLPEDKAKPWAASTVSETEEEAVASTPFWLWALRSDGSDPVVLRVGAGATEYSPSSLPDWARSLPAVVDRWEQFSRTMGGRGGVRRGDLDRETAGGVVPVAAEEERTTLSRAEMLSFWSDLDAALASLVWEPLAATRVLDGVADILIATAGSLHNLPFSVGRRGAAAEARLLHQSSLASFARSRGLFGARPVAPETLAKVRTGTTDSAARRPAVTLLAAEADAPGQEIPLARAERRIAARIWAAAGAEVRLADDYPLDPDAPVALVHAACHGMTATPKGGTRGAHLLLRSAVSERTLLAGKPAGAWLMGACVGGRVHDDGLDGNPTGIVAGALAAGSETVVAALPPLPDGEAFFFGVLVTLQLVDPPLGAAAPERPGPTDEVDLVTAAALAAAIVGGAREAAEVERALPRRTLAALGGSAALAPRLDWLDAGLRWALAEELDKTQGAALMAAMTSGRDDGRDAPLPLPRRKRRILDALTRADPALALCRAGRAKRSGALPVRVTEALAEALAASAGDVTGHEAAVGETGPSLANLLTRALLSLPGAFAVLPDPADPDEHDPATAGTIAHGIVTFHHPGQPRGTTREAAR
jgi:tetratricopeptide (TPR) repeat protein